MLSNLEKNHLEYELKFSDYIGNDLGSSCWNFASTHHGSEGN